MAIDLTDEAYEAALARGRERLSQPYATKVGYDDVSRCLTISFDTGLSFSFDPHKVDILKKLPEAAFAKATVAPGGVGLIFGPWDIESFAVSLPGLLAQLIPPEALQSAHRNQQRNNIAGASKLNVDDRGSQMMRRETPAIWRTSKGEEGGDLLVRVVNLIDDFCKTELPFKQMPGKGGEADATVYLYKYLSAFMPDVAAQSEVRLNPRKSFRADILLTKDEENIVIEVKHAFSNKLFSDAMAQMQSHVLSGDIRNGVLLFLPDRPGEMNMAETIFRELDAHLIALSPT